MSRSLGEESEICCLTSNLEREIWKHKNNVQELPLVRFSTDGQRLYAVDDKAIVSWDSATGLN